MVKKLSSIQKEMIAQSVQKAEQLTSAEIVTVIAPASDTYPSYLLLYGFTIGNIIATGLWATKTVVHFPMLLVIQCMIMALFLFIPWLRTFCVRFVPKQIRDHRTAHRAYAEYLTISAHISATTPIILLYLSEAEHYTHIVTSRLVREKVSPEAWENIINELTLAVPKRGLSGAIINAIEHIVMLLAPHFPEGGEADQFSHTLIELKK